MLQHITQFYIFNNEAIGFDANASISEYMIEVQGLRNGDNG